MEGQKATIRYADSKDGKSLAVRLIAKWDRGDIPELIMSPSSGPKDYIKNQIFSLFESRPTINRVAMVRASGPPFLLVRDQENCWYDSSGKQIVTAK